MAIDNYFGGDALTSVDPLAVIQSIAAASPSLGVVAPAKLPNVPASAIPTKPVGPLPGPSTDATGTGQPPLDWKALLEHAGPLLGAVAMHDPAARTGFINGWLDGQQQAQAVREKRQAQQQQRNQAAANYRLEVGQTAMQITDPVQRAQFIDLAEKSGVTAGFLQPGDLGDLRAVPPGLAATARLKQISDELDKLTKNGYDVGDLVKSNASIQLPDGTHVPVQTALDLTRPTTESGTGLAPTPAGKTAEERFLAKWAKEHGNRTPDDLTATDELQAKTDFANAGKTPQGDDFARFLDKWAREKIGPQASAKDLTTAQEVDARKAYNNAGRNPQLDDINLSLAQLRLDNERQKAKNAGATAASILPGTKEYKVADDLANGRLTFAQLRTLYSFSRDVDKKLALYDKAGEINPNFNPAMFEMGYKFASNPKVQQQVASINNVLSGVGDLLKISDTAARSGAPLLNRFINPAGYALGGKNYSNLAVARKAFADELSGALGYGSATDLAREMGLDMTDPNLSPAAFRSAIEDVVVPFVQRKKASLLGPMGIYGAGSTNPVVPNPAPTTPTPTGSTPSYQDYLRSKGAAN